ncbi:anaerobic sulfatase maturase [Paenibacillus sp. DYY-L-2]|uniref:anaerobic sulfatase maturase n=1 Tax=Paenibacillus sp. DYY-L-2 TaxID=3447013 RepID=UPI003F4FB39E
MQTTTPKPRAFHLLAKPTGPLCNLDCSYCFYTEKEALYPKGHSFYMTDEVLETFIRKYIERQDIPEISFVWQGGEPTLAGLDFYRRVIHYQAKYAGGKKINNSLQTNGTLLDEDWCSFLAENRFLVGLSLDGPEEVHDRYRVDRGKKPTFRKVMRGLNLLREHGVEFNVLVCVTRESAAKPLTVYRFLKEQGIRFIQFIPIVERKPDQLALQWGLRHASPPDPGSTEPQKLVTEWTVEPGAYGDFLIRIFDEWVREDVGSIHVMNFEWALTSWLGLPSTVCIFSENCGQALAVESSGEIFSCDHYVYPNYKLGHILHDEPDQLVQSERQQSFGKNKSATLPSMCRTCEVRFACHGECPKHRFLTTPDGETGLNYLCAGYKRYFRHIHPYMKAMVKLLENGLPAAKVMEVIKGPLVIRGS